MAAPVATERFSGRRLNFHLDLLKWTARREFDVAYGGDEATSIYTVAFQFGVQLGAAHDLTPNLVCTNITADKSLFTVIRVVAEYGVVTGAIAAEDPLRQPPKISWTPTLQSMPLTHTASGLAITTAAGQPYAQRAQTDINTMVLTVERFQPFYDPVAATQIIDTINSDNFVVRGKGMNAAVGPGQCRCKSIAPVGSYFLSANYVKVVWRFEIRPGWAADENGFSDAWDAVFENKGSIGWFESANVGGGESSKPSMGHFYTMDRNLAGDVYLKVDGSPIDGDSYKVTDMLLDAIPNPTPVVSSEPGDIRFQEIDAPGVKGGKIYMLHYQKFQAIPYSGLL